MVDERNIQPPATLTEGEGETLDMPEGLGAFSKGQVLGERYQILEMLGRGGMGEVWHAFDLKLRVEVALKALRPEFFKSERRLELLRQEVRAAREVVSPNVCRIFDLIEIEGRELVSMEYVDGATLLGVLQERGPLELKEAQDIASQFLAGLEAIHKVGLIHRDIKPENIMLTRAGRVVVMDFGLARQEEEGGGSVAGTPAYMAPEQAAGQQLDARADVYAAGVVLAEMVSPDGIKSYESRQSVWEGVRSEPAQVPDSPWAAVITRAVARDRERRQNSAHTLIRELEDVTLRVEGAEDLHPYPGLAAFTEEDAEYFFGREAEIEQMWRKLEGPPRMFAIIGPSGAGKSSFIAAGLMAHAPAGWGILRSTPGNAAISSLATVVARETAGDPDTVELLPRFDDPDVAVRVLQHWRQKHPHALLIVDQFEELFTQNSEAEQRRCAPLLRRFVVECDVHVLLSMRDDFAAACNPFEDLRSIYHELSVLDPPTGANLRRALVQPATKCGYRFEDDELVEEMMTEVEGERGALPLLAFAAARLWQKRDREAGLLTRQAYHDIGGVGGALARHAEATIDRIGTERIPIVRELFRNLVTAEVTRAVREWTELLSVFAGDQTRDSNVGEGFIPSPTAAEEVLRELIDARLLTSYEVREEEREPTRRVEIIHESLLANWPRLVRWQTQDADAAQLRDQLRQAAKTWDDQGRTDDTLWTGSAYREFAVWKDGYPGGLTDVEEAFASAMTAYANRRKRRRRLAVAALLCVAAMVSAVTTTMWRRSVRSERRAEAQKLIALGQVQLEGYPTAALAHAEASLELVDTGEARRLALESLWRGPTAFVVNDRPSIDAAFSADSNWLVQGHEGSSSITVLSREGTQTYLEVAAHSGKTRAWTSFQGDNDLFITFGMANDRGRPSLWSASEERMIVAARPVEQAHVCGPNQSAIVRGDLEARAVVAIGKDDLVVVDALDSDGSRKHLGDVRMTLTVPEGARYCMPQRSGGWLALDESGEISVVEVSEHGLSERRYLGHRNGGRPWRACRFDPDGRFFLTVPASGEIEVWDPTGVKLPRKLVAPPRTAVQFSADGSHLFGTVSPTERGEEGEVLIWRVDGPDFRLLRRIQNVQVRGGSSLDSDGRWFAMRGPLPDNRLWSLEAAAAAEPIAIRRGPAGYVQGVTISPDGRWLATNHTLGLTMWPLVRSQPAVIRVDLVHRVSGLDFDPEGRFLVFSADDTVTVVPLQQPVPPPGGVAFKVGGLSHCLAVSPDGERFAIGGDTGGLWVGANDGRDPVLVGDPSEWRAAYAGTFDPEGHYLAFMTGFYDRSTAVVRVWNLESDTEQATLQLPGAEFRYGVSFSSDGRLLAATTQGVVAWDVESGQLEILVEEGVAAFTANRIGRRLLFIKEPEAGMLQDAVGTPVFVDLDSGLSTPLTTHGSEVWAMALDQDGSIAVTGDRNGIIRVGRVTGEEPHILVGHEGEISHIAIDPLGRWIASAGEDDTVRLWPMPDLSKPPLHTLPRDELIAKLKSLTNLRVVRDEESSTGWKVEVGPFPGWETVPTW